MDASTAAEWHRTSCHSWQTSQVGTIKRCVERISWLIVVLFQLITPP